MGEILLENSDGYLVKRNDAFVFYSKDGERCFYSKFILKSELKLNGDKLYDFSKLDKDLDEFCGNFQLNCRYSKKF